MTEPNEARRVLLAEIAGAHGIRGAVLIKTFTVDPRSIAAYGALESETGGREFRIEIERVTTKGVIARIDGVTDRNAAEKLAGVKLYAARKRLPATPAGEFYHVDLMGLAAVDDTGAVVGEVVGVANYGASDVIEIRLARSNETALLPFTEAFIRDVDLKARRIVVALPAGSPGEDENEGR